MNTRQRAAKMPGASDSWARLAREVRRKAHYRITLIVRGQTIIKEYASEDEYRKWKAAYDEQADDPRSGVESVRGGIVYR